MITTIAAQSGDETAPRFRASDFGDRIRIATALGLLALPFFHAGTERKADEEDKKTAYLNVAKMEKGDPTVSIDLLLQALFRLGFSRKELARAI